MRILIADDSLTTRRLLELTLQGWGYEVVVARDGDEAWDHLSAEDPPPLAILDWIMPGCSGPELCNRVRDLQRSTYTYLLLLTAKNAKEDIVLGMGAGADDYIVKPFDIHELEVRLRAGRRIIDLQIELIKTQAKLKEQATRDALTQCWNRATILEVVTREITRAQREDRPLGLLMVDLDHFKSVNDTYGHAAGDTVLRATVERMSGSMRTYDALGRYGGEEFLVVLPGCTEEASFSHAERLRTAICGSPVDLGWSRITVTGSFGATSMPPTINPTPEQLIHTADDALYQAKRNGRNRVQYLPAVETETTTFPTGNKP